MKTRLICWITIACIAFATMEALRPKVIEQKKTTIQITCPKQTIQCVKTRQIPPTGALPNNQ